MAPTESLDAFGGFAGPASKQFYVATFSVEVCVFAAFLISYVIGTWCLFFCAQSKHPLRPLTVVLFVANTVMLWLAVAHMALDACGAVRGFTEGPPLFDAIKFVIYVLETLIGSSFMIYRLYRVYSRRWRVIIIPSVLLVAAGIIGISSTFLGVPGFYMSAGFYSLELMVDVISSIMILARVKEIGCDSQPTHARNIQMWRVIEALVQSTAITSAASMSLVITFVNSTYIGYPTCLNVLPPLIALVFSLTVLRIALNSGRKATRSESGHSWGISDHGSTMATAEMSSSTLEDAEEKEFTLPIYVSTTTIVQHDLPTHPGFSSNTIHIY
ncbi:hypothetical protein BD309DRAFT_876386 [Dichomitus squalens]|uniref:Uncharacterized protein n=1 Tax=Dichomitus squalens TaxID=114155 RepID=A0A4Q9N9L3_9APHY|nr:hypothetical protein BD309DRAFT_876386 [Dichomitus squalens]TBU52002.1 hypothetical protein BD310DRAFT_890079 [Dichomitus squalens]